MSSGIVVRSVVRASCVAFAALACMSASPKGSVVTLAADRPDANSAVTHYAPEVRLRKLHLVRPDLIPYPVAYEVYC